jgi:hypothetical protein
MGKWSREESLKYAFDVTIVELPTGVTVERDELGIAEDVSMLERFFLRWKKHLNELALLKPYDLLESVVVKKSVSTNATLMSDLHGFKKLAVFVTPNKVVAIDTFTGDAVWTKYFELNLFEIFVTRESRHGVPPLVTVYGQEKGNRMLVTLDALTGEYHGLLNLCRF